LPVHTVVMSLPLRFPLLAACLALLAGTLCGQGRAGREGRRSSDVRPTFGLVKDVEGNPVSDAVVTLVGGLPHLSPALQDIHVVEVATDKRGRAMARLLPGLCYVAWASRPVVDGQRASSEVHGYFAAGAMFELTCGEPLPVPNCTLSGEQSWQHLGALRYFAMTSMPGTEVELVRNAEGRFEPPGLPFDVFEVRLADGQALWHAPIKEELQLPPPQSLRVRVVDEHGKPLAGAKVHHRVGRLSSWRLDGLRSVGEDRMRLLGTSDDDGLCVVEVPYDTNPLRDGRDNLLLFVACEGRPSVAGGIWNRAYYVSDHKVPEIEGDELRFECVEVEPLRGAMANAPAGTTAHLAAVCKLYLQRNSYLHDARVFTAEVGSDGKFAFADLPSELHSCRLSLVPPPGSDWLPPVFAPESGRALPADVMSMVGDPPGPIELISVELLVEDATGGPARGAVAFLSSGDRHGVLLRDSLLRVALDERGSANLRLAPGNWVVVVQTDTGYCGEQLRIDGTSDRAKVSLHALATMKVVLRNAAGKPIAGASVRSRGTSTRGTNDPVSSILQGLSRTMRTQWERLVTDREGQVVIPFVPVEGVQHRVELRWDDGRSDEFALEPDAKLSIGVAESANKR
jgi:hypothetical protein